MSMSDSPPARGVAGLATILRYCLEEPMDAGSSGTSPCHEWLEAGICITCGVKATSKAR